MKTSFQYDAQGAFIEKDPADDLDYWNDWSKELTRTGANIASSEWTVPADITKHDAMVSGTSTGTYLSGGVAGTVYKIDNVMVDNASPPRTYERSFRLVVKEQ